MARVSPYGRPNHCDICGKQGHDYMDCQEYPREGKPMHPTLKDIGEIENRAIEQSDGSIKFIPMRCELVYTGRHDAETCDDPEDLYNFYKRNCTIGRVRVAKWMALDPTEAREDPSPYRLPDTPTHNFISAIGDDGRVHTLIDQEWVDCGYCYAAF